MRIIEADIQNKEHYSAASKLVAEYFEYGNRLSMEWAGISFNTDELLANMRETLAKFTADNRGLLLLIENEGEYFGVGAYRDLGNGHAEMKRVFLRAECRGKGWGRQIVKALMSHAKSAGFTHMNLESGVYLKEAKCLYESLGFKEIDTYAGSECGALDDENLYYMEMAL